MGGGFGGCTINLVREELYDNFITTAKNAYKEKFGKEPVVIDVVIGDGSGAAPAAPAAAPQLQHFP